MRASRNSELGIELGGLGVGVRGFGVGVRCSNSVLEVSHTRFQRRLSNLYFWLDFSVSGLGFKDLGLGFALDVYLQRSD